MRIWHSALASPSPVGGVGQSLERLTRGLAVRGHEIYVLAPGGGRLGIERDPDIANRFRVEVPLRSKTYGSSSLDELATVAPPDLIHLHWTFQPQNTRLAQWARHRDIPYVIHPRGSLAAPALRRRGKRKAVYLGLFEMKLLAGASLAINNTTGDRDDFHRLLPVFGGRSAVIPNPVVATAELEFVTQVRRPIARVDTPRCAYLGRWDVEHKGLDRLARIAGHASGVSFELYSDGVPTLRSSGSGGRMGELPPNVHLRAPVYGREKWRTLSGVQAYVQVSRWESFGNAVAEALVCGTPVFLSREMHLAADLAAVDACVVLDAEDAEGSALALKQALEDVSTLERLRAAGLGAAQAFEEETVAREVEREYRAVLDGATGFGGGAR
jgi:glycosyltransferase involved in cell wall biosynthesis